METKRGRRDDQKRILAYWFENFEGDFQARLDLMNERPILLHYESLQIQLVFQKNAHGRTGANFVLLGPQIKRGIKRGSRGSKRFFAIQVER